MLKELTLENCTVCGKKCRKYDKCFSEYGIIAKAYCSIQCQLLYLVNCDPKEKFQFRQKPLCGYVGTCKSVSDANHIIVTIHDKDFIVRLCNLDGPRLTQPHGMESCLMLRKAVLARECRLIVYTSSNNILCADVFVVDTVQKTSHWLQAHMILNGGAAVYKSNCSRLLQYEKEAKLNYKGMWNNKVYHTRRGKPFLLKRKRHK